MFVENSLKLPNKYKIIHNFALADRKDVCDKEMRSTKYAEEQNKLPDFKKWNPEFNIAYSKTLPGILKKLYDSCNTFFSHIKNEDLKASPSNG
jgi:putative transposase